MHQQISKKIIFYILLFFLFGTVNNLNIYKFKLPHIDKIIIDGFDENERLKILSHLNFLKVQNIFFQDLY